MARNAKKIAYSFQHVKKVLLSNLEACELCMNSIFTLASSCRRPFLSHHMLCSSSIVKKQVSEKVPRCLTQDCSTQSLTYLVGILPHWSKYERMQQLAKNRNCLSWNKNAVLKYVIELVIIIALLLKKKCTQCIKSRYRM